jgi:copper(I)-binding protein
MNFKKQWTPAAWSALGMALVWGLNPLVAQAQTITDAWARATVPGQKATGVFMKIAAKDATRLVAVSSPVAGVSEIHEMKMERDVMKMAALPNGLPVPAGGLVELKPGSFHVMLMDLKAPLAAGSALDLTLTFQDSKGQKTVQQLKVPVRTQVAPAAHMHH